MSSNNNLIFFAVVDVVFVKMIKLTDTKKESNENNILAEKNFPFNIICYQGVEEFGDDNTSQELYQEQLLNADNDLP